jgi:hypothetical protein
MRCVHWLTRVLVGLCDERPIVTRALPLLQGLCWSFGTSPEVERSPPPLEALSGVVMVLGARAPSRATLDACLGLVGLVGAASLGGLRSYAADTRAAAVVALQAHSHAEAVVGHGLDVIRDEVASVGGARRALGLVPWLVALLLEQPAWAGVSAQALRLLARFTDLDPATAASLAWVQAAALHGVINHKRDVGVVEAGLRLLVPLVPHSRDVEDLLPVVRRVVARHGAHDVIGGDVGPLLLHMVEEQVRWAILLTLGSRPVGRVGGHRVL